MADYEKDVEALDRVLFRLASATDERMLDVLQSLLPQLLKLFPRDLTPPSAVQLKDKVRRAFLSSVDVLFGLFYTVVLTVCVYVCVSDPAGGVARQDTAAGAAQSKDAAPSAWSIAARGGFVGVHTQLCVHVYRYVLVLCKLLLGGVCLRVCSRCACTC